MSTIRSYIRSATCCCARSRRVCRASSGDRPRPSPADGRESATLLRRADVAMYAAKRKNLGVAVWDDDYDQHSSDRLSLMTDLRQAVDNDELTLVYQPKVPLGSTHENYVEALVRW